MYLKHIHYVVYFAELVSVINESLAWCKTTQYYQYTHLINVAHRVDIVLVLEVLTRVDPVIHNHVL